MNIICGKLCKYLLLSKHTVATAFVTEAGILLCCWKNEKAQECSKYLASHLTERIVH